ncbi:hypothetical protein E3N88_25897 [Mikania micrantha]|uniref:Uncharacterized protein n=1 Tax=Mikania micrantha TaxID=192012 RepID=A0A5N6N8U0_9ASTR|nr:hypothetical protein E3N88_25897 [Mikania micrantha]
MMNVGENRAQNGVLDCPESKNEEKFLSIGILASSRYAMEELNFLREDHSGSSDHQCVDGGVSFSVLFFLWL